MKKIQLNMFLLIFHCSYHLIMARSFLSRFQQQASFISKLQSIKQILNIYEMQIIQ